MGLKVLIGSIVAMTLLILLDGIMKGPVEVQLIHSHDFSPSENAGFSMLSVWIVDFRYMAEQAIYAATIFFVGAKFFETRSILTIGFDRLDADKIVLKEPGDDNIVWIGHRYANAIEAQSVAGVIADRLKQSAA